MTLRQELTIDPVCEADRLAAGIRDFLGGVKKRGVVVGLSGGIDSSVTAAICVQAIGKERVIGILMPEADSSPESLSLGHLLADSLGIRTVLEDISGILRAAGCYARQNEAIKTLIPEYCDDYKFKIVLSNRIDGQGYPFFSVVVRSPEGAEKSARLPFAAYLSLVAATNFKQRTRAMIEYFHADCRNYAVAGTPNRLEHDQGFFVKNGDGAADLKPIGHLYKSQVYQMAEFLGVPEAIRRRRPTTDTYSLDQTQEEFFFLLPYEQMDMALYARDHAVTAFDAAREIGLSEAQMKRVYETIDSKRRASRYLKMEPQMMAL